MTDRIETSGFSVVVPVHDEAAVLDRTLTALLHGLPEDVELIFVCNGCTDQSEAELRARADPRIVVLVLEECGKSLALRAGDRRASTFPRIYMDADTECSGADLKALADVLRDGPVELASPCLSFDLTACNLWARAIWRTWRRLPHARTAALQNVIGVSRAGRARWGELPDVWADDTWMAMQVPDDRKRIVDGLEAVVRPPRTFLSAVRLRRRIDEGLRQLAAVGTPAPRAPARGAALLSLLCDLRTASDAGVYLAHLLTARTSLVLGRPKHWFRDAGSRAAGHQRHLRA